MQADLESDQGILLVSALGAAARCGSQLAVNLSTDHNLVDSLGDEIHHILISDPK